MAEIVAHVISAEWKHRHGVAAQLSHFADAGCSSFTARGRPQKSSMLPIERFRHQWNYAGPASAEQDSVNGNSSGILPLGSDHRALLGRSGKPGIRVCGFAAGERGPGPSEPVDELGWLFRC